MRPDVAFDRVAFTIALALIFVGLCWCVYGCTAVATQSLGLSKMPKESYLAADVRPCMGLVMCWPWIAVHRMDFYKNAAGDVSPMPEASNGQGLSSLTDPAESALTHFTYGVSW